MTISGNWTLHYSWGGTSSYAQTTLTFNADHTFGGSYTGKWRQQNGTVMLTFDGGPAKYGGTVNGAVGSGVMSTFSGLDGTFYLSQAGTTGILPESALEEAAGQPAAADGSVGDRGSHRFDETRVAAEELAEREKAASTGASTGSTTKSRK
jgi:hypothetical protein